MEGFPHYENETVVLFFWPGAIDILQAVCQVGHMETHMKNTDLRPTMAAIRAMTPTVRAKWDAIEADIRERAARSAEERK